jgi:hypothetical protein
MFLNQISNEEIDVVWVDVFFLFGVEDVKNGFFVFSKLGFDFFDEFLEGIGAVLTTLH